MINFHLFLYKEISLALIQRSSLLCSLLVCLQTIRVMRKGERSWAEETRAWSPNMGKAGLNPPPSVSLWPLSEIRLIAVKTYMVGFRLPQHINNCSVRIQAAKPKL